MILSNNVPTVFARSLAETVDLLRIFKLENHVPYNQELARLKAFQQMSIVTTFEESMIAFHGIKINKTQKEALQVIYKSTRPWMLGHVVGVLLDKLDSKGQNLQTHLPDSRL